MIRASKSSYRWQKVAIHLLVARYLARAAFHPCLHLFQSQTNAKHKVRTTAWFSAAIFYSGITSLIEGTKVAHVNTKRVETRSKPGRNRVETRSKTVPVNRVSCTCDSQCKEDTGHCRSQENVYIAINVKWTISSLESSPARGSALMSSATWASKIVTNDRDQCTHAHVRRSVLYTYSPKADLSSSALFRSILVCRV